jgi:thymidylate synthase (FAD)
MKDIIFTDEITVELIDKMGGDERIARTAMVSTGKDLEELTPQKTKGLINYLIKHRHGSPFESGSMTFRVHGPIFMWREHMRHRIGWSFNEESGRYKQLDPIFWLPKPERKIVPVPDPGEDCTETLIDKYSIYVDKVPCLGSLQKIENGTKVCNNCSKTYKYHTSARPMFQKGSEQDHKDLCLILKKSYEESYRTYEDLLGFNYAKEVSRACLPVGIYSSCYVTCNPRSLMHFLSLRVHNPDALFVSYPQYEIELVARAYEQIFKEGWPITYQAFVDNKWTPA